MLRRPPVPCGVIVILFHEDSKKCVVLQPGGFFFAKFAETGLSIFAGVSGEIRERLLKQPPLQFFDVAIFNSTTAQPAKIDLWQSSIKVFAR